MKIPNRRRGLIHLNSDGLHVVFGTCVNWIAAFVILLNKYRRNEAGFGMLQGIGPPQNPQTGSMPSNQTRTPARYAFSRIKNVRNVSPCSL